MAVFLREIGIENYRSIGGDGVLISDLGDINVLIGQNNTGKSNILRLLNHYGIVGEEGHIGVRELDTTDHHKNDAGNHISLRIGISDASDLQKLTNSNNPYPYVDYGYSNGKFNVKSSFLSRSNTSDIVDYCRSNFAEVHGDMRNNVRLIENNYRFKNIFKLPKIVFVDESRVRLQTQKIRNEMHSVWNHGAKNMHMKPVKTALRNFIKVALLQDFELHFEEGSASFSIEYSDGEIVDFESLGSGIKQIFSMGLAIANTQNSIVLLDEPELNMHPNLLRKLLELIFSNTTNQYIVATHSNVLLDALNDKRIFQVAWDGATRVKACTVADDVRSLLDDLGIKASEILQTNGIIWVEGPSDRHYIKRWLELAGCKYQEGMHYNFQYYGGKLLAHVTVDDDLKEFVNLLDINRHAFLVMDSDYSGDDTWNASDLAPRKRRILEESEKKAIRVWTTKGREIENYIPDNIWTIFQGSQISLNKNENAHEKISKYTNKPLNAQEICRLLKKHDYQNNIELMQQIERLIIEIETWNA